MNYGTSKLNKNRESILKAHKEVSDPTGKTNWYCIAN